MHCTITHENERLRLRLRLFSPVAPAESSSSFNQPWPGPRRRHPIVNKSILYSISSITHPACCQCLGSWAAVEVIFNSPPAGRRRGVRRFVALHESLHGSPTRTDFSFQYQVLPIVQCWWYSHSNSKSGPLASCTACFMSPLQALLVCLPRTSRGISRFPLPRRVLVGEVAASAIQCISPIGTAPD